MIIKSLLDSDLYKITMGQMAFHQYFGKIVKYKFICRNKEVNLSKYREEIEKELHSVCDLVFKKEEIDYLRTIKDGIFKEDYLDYLSNFKMDKKEIKVFIKDDSLNIEAEGPWQSAIFWEIYVLSIVNEVYFRNTQPSADKNLGKKKLYDKISLVKDLNKNSNIKFSFMEFGTRRRYSANWQREVCEILKKELLGNGFIGTSNVYLAMILDIPVHGTMAHEAFQFHQGLNSPYKDEVNRSESYFKSQENTLKSWLKEYNGKLSIALSDIFGTDAFLSILDKELSEKYEGLRHDSGDPFVWADKVLDHYKEIGIDPKSKTLVFSDGLNFEKAKEIFLRYKEKAKIIFGIGTNLSNDFNFKSMNIVMKMVESEGNPVVKISDEQTKAIGDEKVIKLIKNYFFNKKGILI